MILRPLIVCLTTAAAVLAAAPTFTPRALTGQTFTHDPSTIMADHGQYFFYSTGPGIRVRVSPNLPNWDHTAPVFQTVPEWTKKAVPGFDGVVWAPDLVRVNGKFLLYYSCSTFGKQISALGLASATTLDPNQPGYGWKDEGMILNSTNGMPYNTIDPSAFLDRDGKLWLAFGSYWQGIFLVALDPQTGKRLDPALPPKNLAWNHSIEAACLTRHDDHYYLFVNWGTCCQGTNSTYEVRVGRADKVTGPYRDKDGNDLTSGGGSPFLASQGIYIGPGHIGILDDGATNTLTRFSFHYYDATAKGRSRLGLGRIDWATGWPVAVN